MNTQNDLFSLKGKVSLITGAYRGNGKEFARALGNAGSDLILLDTNKNLKSVCDEFNSIGISTKFYICDLSNLNQLKKVLKNLIRENKKIDVLVNNAGITISNDFEKYKLDDWIKTFNVNLFSKFLIIQGISKLMKKNKYGSIINITSLNAELAFPDNPAYVASKGGLKQLTKSAANDLGKYNIRCNNVGPGYIRTNMTLRSWNNKARREKIKKNTVLNRWGLSKDLIGIIIFLASESSSYITGQDFYVDGGWMIKGLK